MTPEQRNALILAGLGTGLHILSTYLLKNPEALDGLTPVVTALLGAMSQSAGETSEQTAARLAYHDALVKKYTGMSPPP